MPTQIRSIPIVRRFSNGDTSSHLDMVAVEEPLELRVEGEPTAVLMRTPGQDLNLCRGFLFTEGVIEDRDDIHAIAHIDSPTRPKGNTVDVRLSSGVPLLRREKAKRSFFASSSCGICGKESIDRVITSEPKSPSLQNLTSVFCSLFRKNFELSNRGSPRQAEFMQLVYLIQREHCST